MYDINKEIEKSLEDLGDIFNLVGIASRELSKYGYKEEATKLRKDVFKCESYDEALRLIMDYVDVC